MITTLEAMSTPHASSSSQSSRSGRSTSRRRARGRAIAAASLVVALGASACATQDEVEGRYTDGTPRKASSQSANPSDAQGQPGDKSPAAQPSGKQGQSESKKPVPERAQWEHDKKNITVKHSLGTTVVPLQPRRIVTMSGVWSDALEALGVKTVGQLVSTAQENPGNVPWTARGHGDNSTSGEILTYILDPSEVTLDDVKALQPDVILGGWLPTAEVYEDFAAIAPTVPVLVPATGFDDWREVTKLAGILTGKEDQAKDLIAKTTGTLDALKKQLPKLSGKTVSFAMKTGDMINAVATDANPATQLFTDLGMKVNPKLKKVGQAEEFARITENTIAELDADLIVLWDKDDSARSMPGFEDLQAVRDGRVARINQAELNALAPLSVTSVPWIAERLKSALSRVAA